MRQASRRSWRIGQTRPVKGIFMAYRGTLQADALKLVAQKLQSSLAVEGELPEDGLAAYGDDVDDIMLALARKIVNGEEEEERESVEDAFAQARDAEALSEKLLVDDEWGPWGWSRSQWWSRCIGTGPEPPPWRRPTVTTTKPLRHSGRSSPGQSAWPRSQWRDRTDAVRRKPRGGIPDKLDVAVTTAQRAID